MPRDVEANAAVVVFAGGGAIGSRRNGASPRSRTLVVPVADRNRPTTPVHGTPLDEPCAIAPSMVTASRRSLVGLKIEQYFILLHASPCFLWMRETNRS